MWIELPDSSPHHFFLWNLFQGHVTSVPKHSLDAVPIQIMCHRTPDGKSEYEDQTFKCLWKNAQHVVEFSIRNPSSVKYQLNFCLMLQEVLRNNNHLLTEDEKTYMGININTYDLFSLTKFLSDSLNFKHCLIHWQSHSLHSQMTVRGFLFGYTLEKVIGIFEIWLLILYLKCLWYL